MNEIPDLSVWSHRWCEFTPRVIESIGRYVRRSYNLIVVAEPGNCHENMQRALDRSTSRFLCFMDEDIALLDPYVIDRLIGILCHPEVAMVVPMQTYSWDVAKQYQEHIEKNGPPPEATRNVLQQAWVGAYCMMVDRSKVPSLYADLNIPWIKGMTDVDMGLQVNAAKYKVLVAKDLLVFHEDKGKWSKEKSDEYQNPTVADWRAGPNVEQLKYMQEKWGFEVMGWAGSNSGGGVLLNPVFDW